MYGYVLTSSTSVLPKVASRTMPTSRATLNSVKRYAKELANEYPEQSDLIKDISSAAQAAHNQKVTNNLYKQLLDLERYLFVTSY